MSSKEYAEYLQVTATKGLKYNGTFYIYRINRKGERAESVKIKGKLKTYIVFKALQKLWSKSTIEVIQDH